MSTALSILDRRKIEPSANLYSPSIVSTAAGCITFGSTLGVATFFQKFMGISTGSVRPIPTMIGIASVGIASIASHYASVEVFQKITNPHRKRHQESFPFGYDGLSISKHTLRICAVGLIAFKVLGGRFWAVAPSSYTHIGSYARRSIPATTNYATQAQKGLLNQIGRASGCHTCGRRIGQFGRTVIGDHQPPLSVAKQRNSQLWRKLLNTKVKFRLYPQCSSCSHCQGKLLASAANKMTKWWQNKPNLAGVGGGSRSYSHGFQFRLNHLAGGAVAVASIPAGEDVDLDIKAKLYLCRLRDFLDSLPLR